MGWQLCRDIQNVALHTHRCCHYWNILPTFCAHVLCLVSINVQQVSLNVNNCLFSVCINSLYHLCFLHTFILDVILIDCGWPAIYNKGCKVMGYYWKCSQSTLIPSTSSSNIVGRNNNIGSFTFRAKFMQHKLDWWFVSHILSYQKISLLYWSPLYQFYFKGFIPSQYL